MKKGILDNHQRPSRKRIRNLLVLANDQDLQSSFADLMNTPEEWDAAMDDPAAWMRANGIKLPRGMQAVITKELSISKPVDPGTIGLPGPDWLPYIFKFINCRTYWVATKDEEGRITGYHDETICFGFEIQLNPFPGPLG